MDRSELKQHRVLFRHVIIITFLLIWLAVVLTYSLWPKRPASNIDHEIALGVATVALAAGLASLLLVGRRRLQLGLGIVSVLIGSGFILELAQGHFVEAARNESGDMLVVAAGAFVGVAIVGGLAGLVGPAWCQRIVATCLLLGATGAIVVPGLRTPAFTNWWNCDRPGAPANDQPLFELRAVSLTGDGLGYGDAESIFCSMADASSFKLTMSARTDDLTQRGPARLLTLSGGPNEDQIHFHVGQDGADLSIRLRTTADSYDQLVVDDVFTDTRWHDYSITFDAGTLTASVDGELVGTLVTSQATLAGWDERWPLTLGNELSGDRPFIGSLENLVLVSDTTKAPN